MQYDEIMQELKEMKPHYDGGFSLLEKQRIVELYWRILRKKINNLNCSDCYRDAFLEIYSFLKKNGKLPEERHYELKDGKCLHVFGSSEYLFDVTDEQAEKFLAQCPAAIGNFKSYPEDWEERVQNRMNKKPRGGRKKKDDNTEKE